MNRKKQLRLNIECLCAEYYNGMTDYPEEYKPMTKEEVLKYCKVNIYDMIDDGLGCTHYGTGIAKELKFLGDEYIEEEILKIAKENDVLA